MPDGAEAGSTGQFGRYQLIASLGHGGMADVYLAVVRGPVGFNKLQVVKRLRPNLAEEPEFLSMFLDEARLAARLNHPNVVQTNEVGEDGGHYFIAMEYLDGQPLNRILLRSRRTTDAELPLEARLTIVAEALAGLHYAHELSDYDGRPLEVVHRDSSPHNIFVTYDGHVKVVDFGIAKAASHCVQTRGGVLKGKVAYMSPEQARCDPVDRRADVFAMGLVLWELLVGERFWRNASDVVVLDALSSGAPLRTPRSVRRDVPPELDAICARALAIDPARRYGTAEQMRQDLLHYLEWSGRRPATHDDIGQLVAQLFWDRRRELKTQIDRQLSALATTNQQSPLNLVELHAPTTTSSWQSLSPPPGPFNLVDLAADKGSGSQPTYSQAAMVGATAASPRKGRRLGLALAASAAMLAGAVAALLTMRSAGSGADVAGPAAEGSGSNTSSAAAATDTGRAAERGTVVLRVEVQPEGAAVWLDGARVGASPLRLERERDADEHRLRIEADGYEPDEQTVTLEADVQVVVTLQRTDRSRLTAGARPPAPPGRRPSSGETSPSATAAPTAAPAAPVTDPTGLSGRPGQPKKRDLDPSDPWAQ